MTERTKGVRREGTEGRRREQQRKECGKRREISQRKELRGSGGEGGAEKTHLGQMTRRIL